MKAPSVNRSSLAMCVAILALAATCASAAPPNLINYQGRLSNKDGAPFTGNAAIQLALFPQASGGTALYNQDLGQVQVKQGIYSFAFGGELLPQALQNPECWIELTVDGTILQPRQRLLSVPYAVDAGKVEGHSWADITAPIGSDRIANGAVTSAKLSIGTPQAGNIIKWDGAKWTAASGEVPVHSHTGTGDGGILPNGDFLVATAQNAFQVVEVSNFKNRDFLAADYFTDADGKTNTINAPATTAIYQGGLYANLAASSAIDSDASSGLININNAFDASEATVATASVGGGGTYYCGRYWSSPAYIPIVKISCNAINNAGGSGINTTVKLQSYNGGSWSDEYTFCSDNGSGSHSVNVVYPVKKSVCGLRLSIYMATANYGGNISIGSFVFASEPGVRTIRTNTVLPLDGTEKMCAIYVNADQGQNSSLTVDVSDGATTLATRPINKMIDISSLGPGNLQFAFNLNASDNKSLVSVYGYGVAISK